MLAFTGGWAQEMKAYQADIAGFEETNTQVLGITVGQGESAIDPTGAYRSCAALG